MPKEKKYTLAQVSKVQMEQIKKIIEQSDGRFRSITHVLEYALRQFILSFKNK